MSARDLLRADLRPLLTSSAPTKVRLLSRCLKRVPRDHFRHLPGKEQESVLHNIATRLLRRLGGKRPSTVGPHPRSLISPPQTDDSPSGADSRFIGPRAMTMPSDISSRVLSIKVVGHVCRVSSVGIVRWTCSGASRHEHGCNAKA